jgi:hypothetical protein
VEDVTFNIGDQKAQELEIRRQAPAARVVRRSMAEIGKCGRLEQDKRLIVDNMEVAVVYWRCGKFFLKRQCHEILNLGFFVKGTATRFSTSGFLFIK